MLKKQLRDSIHPSWMCLVFINHSLNVIMRASACVHSTPNSTDVSDIKTKTFTLQLSLLIKKGVDGEPVRNAVCSGWVGASSGLQLSSGLPLLEHGHPREQRAPCCGPSCSEQCPINIEGSLAAFWLGQNALKKQQVAASGRSASSWLWSVAGCCSGALPALSFFSTESSRTPKQEPVFRRVTMEDSVI